MLPEPTIPKPSATLSAVSGPWVMTPLFCVPDRAGADATPPRPSGRRATTPLRATRRTSSRAKTGTRSTPRAEGQDTEDLLAVTAERLRQALWRSFLRYGIPGDLDSTVHAAMNVIEPVLHARDTEIQRLLRLIPVKAATGKTTTTSATGAHSPAVRSPGSRSRSTAPRTRASRTATPTTADPPAVATAATATATATATVTAAEASLA
jgi:hypothetical protein